MTYKDVVAADKFATKDNDDDYTFPLVTDNNEPKPADRKGADDIEVEEDGKAFRDSLCTALYADGLKRQKTDRMKYNDLGHAYFE